MLILLQAIFFHILWGEKKRSVRIDRMDFIFEIALEVVSKYSQ